MGSSFFSEVEKSRVLQDPSAVYDWLFNDNRFSGSNWSPAKKASLTKAIKKFDGFNRGRYQRKSKGVSYPRFASPRNKQKKPYALFSSKTGSSEDFIRHIRNGIAHGNAHCYRANKSTFLEIIDCHNGKQTAYIAMPLAYLECIYRLAKGIENR